MPRKIQISYTKARTKTVACMGDSLFWNGAYIMMGPEYVPGQLQDLLDAAGCVAKVRNFGVSGEKSTQMLARINEVYQYDIPDLVCIWAGQNDAGGGIAATTTRDNIKAMAAAVIAQGVTRVLIQSRHFLNYTGGDTVAGTPTDDDPPTNLHAAQRVAYTEALAANSGKIAWFDTWDYQRDILVATPTLYWSGGTDVWHQASGDVHLKPAGALVVAQGMYAALNAMGWVDELK